MQEYEVAKIAAEYAKEIVVSKLAISSKVTNADSGKEVAEYYTAIYKGIFETLKADLSNK